MSILFLNTFTLQVLIWSVDIYFTHSVSEHGPGALSIPIYNVVHVKNASDWVPTGPRQPVIRTAY